MADKSKSIIVGKRVSFSGTTMLLLCSDALANSRNLSQPTINARAKSHIQHANYENP
jgi:hypothetical protein